MSSNQHRAEVAFRYKLSEEELFSFTRIITTTYCVLENALLYCSPCFNVPKLHRSLFAAQKDFIEIGAGVHNSCYVK